MFETLKALAKKYKDNSTSLSKLEQKKMVIEMRKTFETCLRIKPEGYPDVPDVINTLKKIQSDLE